MVQDHFCKNTFLTHFSPIFDPKTSPFQGFLAFSMGQNPSPWAQNAQKKGCLSIPNGSGSLLDKHGFDPFLTLFWSVNDPFSRHFGIFHCPQRGTGSKPAKNTCLSIPSGLGTTSEKNIFFAPGTLVDPPLAPTLRGPGSPPPAVPSDHWYGCLGVPLGDSEITAVLEALPAPRTPLDVADVPHHLGLPGARMQHALLRMAAADGGMSMLMTASVQHVKDAMQQQQMHAPQPWEESAKRWLQVEGVPPTHTVGMADMGKLMVLEGAEYRACVRVEAGGLEWIVVTACRLRRQQSRGPACYRVFREYIRSLGPVRRAHRCTTGDIPQAPAVFVEVTRPPKVQGQDVWPVAPSSMWQAEHTAVMCRALQGEASALPRAPAAQSSRNRPAALVALLHSGSRAWCCVVVALEPHSSALRLYDRGEGTVLTVRPADVEALHLGALSGDGGTALYLEGTVVGSAAMRFRRQSGGDALRLVMAENMGPWLQVFSTSRWKVGGDREKFADAWRRWLMEQFPVGGMLYLPSREACRQCGLRLPRPLWQSQLRRRRPSHHPRRAPHISMAATPTFGTCCGASAANWPRSSVGRR